MGFLSDPDRETLPELRVRHDFASDVAVAKIASALGAEPSVIEAALDEMFAHERRRATIQRIEAAFGWRLRWGALLRSDERVAMLLERKRLTAACNFMDAA